MHLNPIPILSVPPSSSSSFPQSRLHNSHFPTLTTTTRCHPVYAACWDCAVSYPSLFLSAHCFVLRYICKETKSRFKAAPDPSDKLYTINLHTLIASYIAWAWKCPAAPYHPSRFPALLPPIRPISCHHVDRRISRDTNPVSRRLHFILALVITVLFFCALLFGWQSFTRVRY